MLGGFVLSVGAVAGRCSLCGGTGGGVRAAGFSLFRPGCRVGIYDLWCRHGSCAVLCGGAHRLGRRAGNGCLSPRRDARLPMALSCLAVGLTGAVLQLRLGGGAADYALVLGESILAGGGGYFFFRAEHCNYRRLRCKAAPTGDLVCVLISGSLLLMSLSRLTIFGIAPARIAAVLLILITLRFGSSRLGSPWRCAWGSPWVWPGKTPCFC